MKEIARALKEDDGEADVEGEVEGGVTEKQESELHETGPHPPVPHSVAKIKSVCSAKNGSGSRRGVG